MKSLYQELKDAGVSTGSHESDLYFQRSNESMAILAKHPLQRSNATGFMNEAPPNAGELWIDVPFAYDPFWEKLGTK